MLSMSDLAMLISRLPTSVFFGTWSFPGSASSSAKCINSRTSAPSSGLTPARYCRVLMTTFATPTLLVSFKHPAGARRLYLRLSAAPDSTVYRRTLDQFLPDRQSPGCRQSEWLRDQPAQNLHP